VTGFHCGPVGEVDSGVGVIVRGHLGVTWAIAIVVQASQIFGGANSAAASS